jgi:hypothetical protein
MSMCGRVRSSQPGIHQLPAPARTSSAGANRSTVMAASATPRESPTPNCFTVGIVVQHEAPENGHHDQRRRADQACPQMRGRRRPAPGLPSRPRRRALDLADREPLGVHREPEQHREHHQRHVARDRVGSTRRVEADEAQPPAWNTARDETERRVRPTERWQRPPGHDDDRTERGDDRRIRSDSAKYAEPLRNPCTLCFYA